MRQSRQALLALSDVCAVTQDTQGGLKGNVSQTSSLDALVGL